MKRVGVVAVAVAAACLGAPAALAQEDDGVRFPHLFGYDTDPGSNARIPISELHSLNVVVEPADLATYGRLIGSPVAPAAPPSGSADPERPLIDFKLHSVGGDFDPATGRATGGTMETWIDLRARWCGRTGWFNNATAVDNPALYAVSRATGYPKILAESIVLTRSADGQRATGVVTQAGEELVRLEWRRDDAAVAAALEAEPWRAAWLAGEGRAYQGKSWTYEPVADVGPVVKEVQTDPVEGVEQRWDSRVGMVTVTVSRHANRLLTNGNWMALVPEAVEVPGMLESYEGGGEFYGRSLQCGARGSVTTDPAPFADTVAP